MTLFLLAIWPVGYPFFSVSWNLLALSFENADGGLSGGSYLLSPMEQGLHAGPLSSNLAGQPGRISKRNVPLS